MGQRFSIFQYILGDENETAQASLCNVRRTICMFDLFVVSANPKANQLSLLILEGSSYFKSNSNYSKKNYFSFLLFF